ncbi:MAG: thiamine pyrophosphate-binding protein [Alphaproteobacteria bacterium]|jgi:acetolactate synthase-1/2/3 large subunit|nr:thiamine pyrophosphate-binding protein [Alphaproteobacteria bacterium]
MTTSQARRSGGQILVDQLVIHGVDHAFGVPGESYLEVLDALHDAAIRFVICRHEGGASNMADAYGKLTGRPGICMVTRGPGATHAANGLHTAFQDSTPMILFIGQVGRDMIEREAFQEVDYRRMFGQMAKWVAEIDDAARISEYVARAFQVATSGRPGPVVLALPEDMLRDEVVAVDPRPYQPVQAHPGAAAMAEFRALLAQARQPMVILGGGTWTPQAVADIRAFAEANALPVATSFRAQDCFDNDHAQYVGDVGIGINPKLAARIRDCDLLIVAGARLGEMTTSGYTLIDVPVPAQPLVHVLPGAEEIGRVYQPTLGINAGMAAFAAAARALPPVEGHWRGWTEAARADYLAWTAPGPGIGAVDMAAVVRQVDAAFPADVIVTNGAGNYATWVHRYHRYRRYRSILAPTNGAMGYGLPAAIAAKLAAPDREVVCFAGDGCFMMYASELATAAQYDAKILVIVVNNGMYGTIRMHQERRFPARVSGTELKNPDFAAYARSFGLHGETVTRTEDFAAALERARSAPTTALIELRVDPEALTIRQSLSQIRAQAQKEHAQEG